MSEKCLSADIVLYLVISERSYTCARKTGQPYLFNGKDNFVPV